LPLEEVLSEDGFELNSNRRDFLKYFGFSVTAVTLAACYKTKVRHAVPYLVKPEDVTPGVANYYRSTCGGCSVGCGIEVKVREGRPIKVDGNPESVIANGGLCASGQASILSLYDTERLANPVSKGSEVTDWSKVDGDITNALKSIQTAGGKVALVSATVNSPSTLKSIEAFKTAFPNVEHVTYDAVSYHGMLNANAEDFGKRALPRYNFAQAKTIVSFGADFLGTWLSPVEYTKGYTVNRMPQVEGGMSLHIQFESALSLTGTNADYRFPMQSSKELAYVTTLYNVIARNSGAKEVPVPTNSELAGNSIDKAAKALLAQKGKSLVLSSSNDVAVQKMVNAINVLLNNYGTTIDIVNHSNQFKGDDAAVANVLAGLNSGAISGVIFYGVNPVFNHSKDWATAIAKANCQFHLLKAKMKLLQFVDLYVLITIIWKAGMIVSQ